MGVGTKTINRYLQLLSDIFLVRHLQPYRTNKGKRLIKSPKTYTRDSGLLHYLLSIETYEQLMSNLISGLSWEGFFIENLTSALPWGSEPMFYRTSSGIEVDLVVEHTDQSIWAIEIKLSNPFRLSKGFYSAINDLNPEKTFVVHSETRRYPLDDSLEAIPLFDLMEKIKSFKSKH